MPSRSRHHLRAALRHVAKVGAVGLAILALASGCTAAASEDETALGTGAATSSDGVAGVVYYHGIDGRGWTQKTLIGELAPIDLITPRFDNAGLQKEPEKNVLSFIEEHDSNVVVSGFSLGRVPVFRLMKAEARGMDRVVLLDPTYDDAAAIARGLKGGPIVRQWLDGAETRSFLLVYGHETVFLKGIESYKASLANHPRATLCFLPAGHDRFSQPDMVAALRAKDCAELESKLKTKPK